LPNIKEGQEIFIINSEKIKRLNFASEDICRGVLNRHLYASGFNGVFYLDDLDKIAFLIKEVAEKE